VQNDIAHAVHRFVGPPADLGVIQLIQTMVDPLIPIRKPAPALGQERLADSLLV
jgi:hypothetical protein